MKQEIRRNLAPVLVFLILVSLVHWQLKFSLVFFWLGVFLGYCLFFADQLVYCYFQAPHELGSQRVKRLFSQKQYQEGFLALLRTQEEREKLIFHSVFFQIVLLVVSLFVLTSSASLLGKGLVLGLLLHSLFDQLEGFREEGQVNNWFWQFKWVPSSQIQMLYLVAIALLLTIFSLFLI